VWPIISWVGFESSLRKFRILNVRTISAAYSLLTGISIIIVWSIYLATGNVFGATPSPVGLTYHIAAECAAAATLAAAGVGLFARKPWAKSVFILGMGMLLYAVINSPGLYPGRDGNLLKFVFASSGVTAIVFIILGLRIKE
jgi:hypothetical protein